MQTEPDLSGSILRFSCGVAALSFLHCLTKDVLDLAVHAAQLSLCPALKLGPKRRIDPQ
jgi:hypothetical protein